MAGISFKNVKKVYPGNIEVIPNLNLEIKDKEFVILVGPSGCGKSTTLRMIAGLEEISAGELYIGDKLVNDVSPKDRDIAMVFQNYALYPHMTVYKNIAFGLKLRKMPDEEIDRKVHEAAKILDLEHLLDRKPKALSGGQRQRVALGRAMVRNPEVFLLDEPLSNLDAKLRTGMRSEISKLHKRLNTTFVYVTHDQTEAMTMGDRICVMKDGVIQQFDTPQNLYDYPDNLFVAGFIGSPQMNFINAVIEEDASGLYAGFDKFRLPMDEQKADKLRAYVGQEVVIGIRPENFSLAATEDNVHIEALVDLAELLGAETNIYLEAGSAKLIARLPSNLKVAEGENIRLQINLGKIHVFDIKTEKAICH